MDSMSSKIEKHTRQLSELQENKVNNKDDARNRREINRRMKEIDKAHGELLNQQTSLESYIEKYMPLKMQH